MATDDARAAATIRTTLSGSVIAGSLVVLGAQAAIATFTIEKKEALFWFYAWSITAAALLVLSTIAGAKGITAVYAEGYGGKWQRDTGKNFFGPQAVLAIFGAVFVLVSVNLGTLKQDAGSVGLSQKMAVLEQQVGQLTRQLQAASADIDAVKKKFGEPAAYDEETRYRGIVERVQGALEAKALYQDGAVDGLVGPKTRRALQEFQRREGLPVTGRIDSATVKRLGL